MTQPGAIDTNSRVGILLSCWIYSLSSIYCRVIPTVAQQVIQCVSSPHDSSCPWSTHQAMLRSDLCLHFMVDYGVQLDTTMHSPVICLAKHYPPLPKLNHSRRNDHIPSLLVVPYLPLFRSFSIQSSAVRLPIQNPPQSQCSTFTSQPFVSD